MGSLLADGIPGLEAVRGGIEKLCSLWYFILLKRSQRFSIAMTSCATNAEQNLASSSANEPPQPAQLFDATPEGFES